MSKHAKRGLLGTLKRLVGFSRCSHVRTFEFFPDDCFWNRDGKNKGKMPHGAKITGCMDCGKVWASNYAE